MSTLGNYLSTSAPTCGLEGMVGQQRVRGCADLDAAAGARGLHAAGGVPAGAEALLGQNSTSYAAMRELEHGHH